MKYKKQSKPIVILLLITLLLILLPSNEKTVSGNGDALFVTEGGTGTDCSRTNPGPLQYCVETKAQSGDTVYVGEGFYVAEDPIDDNLLLIEKSIHLIGSCTWDATGPITCEPQNVVPAVTPSRLNGENQRRVIAVQGPGISVTIENFIIYQGSAEGKDPAPLGSGYGGGIYANNMSSLVLNNNYIWSNKASASEISSGYGYGGGIYAANIQDLELLENVIILNSASEPAVTGYGGGVFVESSGDGGKVKIVSNRFHENMVGDSTTYSRAGGASLEDVNNLQLDDNIFEYHNHTIRHYWTTASALDLFNVTADSIDQNIFTDNYGDSIVVLSSLTGDFTRNQFWNNDSSYDLIIQHGFVVNVINNFFGKLYPYTTTFGEETNVSRGGISTLVLVRAACGIPQVNIVHNTFALAEYGVQMEGTVEVDINRNIFTSHSKTAIDILDPGLAVVDVNENLFYSNTANGETGTTYWQGDPLFVDLSNGDFHLQPNSAAIDKVSGGTITTDIDNHPRPMGLGVDLGADEYGFVIFLPMITR